MSKKLLKKFLSFFIIQKFLCEFSKFFSNITLIFSFLFGELPIAGYRVTQVYSRQTPKVGLLIINQ